MKKCKCFIEQDEYEIDTRKALLVVIPLYILFFIWLGIKLL